MRQWNIGKLAEKYAYFCKLLNNIISEMSLNSLHWTTYNHVKHKCIKQKENTF